VVSQICRIAVSKEARKKIKEKRKKQNKRETLSFRARQCEGRNLAAVPLRASVAKVTLSSPVVVYLIAAKTQRTRKKKIKD
jgi:hypothetical protein